MPILLSHPQPHVVLITIDNQAKRNAMSRAMMAELAGLWDQLESSTCRAIVLTGAGAQAFCAGADVSGDLSASEETARMINRALLKTSSYPKPIIAAVNGVCAGGGVELMLSCDIRVSAPQARFGLPEVKCGDQCHHDHGCRKPRGAHDRADHDGDHERGHLPRAERRGSQPPWFLRRDADRESHQPRSGQQPHRGCGRGVRVHETRAQQHPRTGQLGHARAGELRHAVRPAAPAIIGSAIRHRHSAIGLNIRWRCHFFAHRASARSLGKEAAKSCLDAP